MQRVTMVIITIHITQSAHSSKLNHVKQTSINKWIFA